MQPFQIIEVDPQGADALSLLKQAAIEARALYPELFAPDAPWPTNPPTDTRGVYLILYQANTPLACGALEALDEAEAEIRRMFVAHEARRRGLAKAMLTALESHARRLGFNRLKLETGYKQAPAISLYKSQGFRPMMPYGNYANDPTSVCFEKCL